MRQLRERLHYNRDPFYMLCQFISFFQVSIDDDEICACICQVLGSQSTHLPCPNDNGAISTKISTKNLFSLTHSHRCYGDRIFRDICRVSYHGSATKSVVHHTRHFLSRKTMVIRKFKSFFDLPHYLRLPNNQAI